MATVGLLLETMFMIRSYGYSYLPSPSLPWLLSGYVAALTWLIAILAAILGKGRVHWFLLFYAVSSFIGIYFFLGMMD